MPAQLALSLSSKPTQVGFATGDIFGPMSAADTDAYFAALAATKVAVVRTDVKMVDVQPARSTDLTKDGSWSEPDKVVRAAVTHGQWLHLIANAPARWVTDGMSNGDPAGWAPSDGNGQNDGVASFVTFAKAAAYRYCTVTTRLEVLSGANKFQAYWLNTDAYAKLFVQVKAAVATVCPSITVVPSGTASVGHTGDQEGYTPVDWYGELCKSSDFAGTSPAANLQPFDFPTTPADPSNSAGQWAMVSKVNSVLHDKCKIDHPEVIISAIGWPTAGGGQNPVNDRYPVWKNDHQAVTSARQAEFVADTIAGAKALRAGGVNVSTVMFYSFRDEKSGDPDIWKNMGLFNDKYTVKDQKSVDAIAAFANGT
jgi:hypothetical protein